MLGNGSFTFTYLTEYHCPVYSATTATCRVTIKPHKCSYFFSDICSFSFLGYQSLPGSDHTFISVLLWKPHACNDSGLNSCRIQLHFSQWNYALGKEYSVLWVISDPKYLTLSLCWMPVTQYWSHVWALRSLSAPRPHIGQPFPLLTFARFVTDLGWNRWGPKSLPGQNPQEFQYNFCLRTVGVIQPNVRTNVLEAFSRQHPNYRLELDICGTNPCCILQPELLCREPHNKNKADLSFTKAFH